MGLMNRAFRSIWRKKMRTAVVLTLLCLSMGTLISVYSTVQASKDNTEEMIEGYQATMERMVDQSQNDLLLITISQMGMGRDFGQMSSGTDTEGNRTGIPVSEIDEIKTLDSVDAVVPSISRTYGNFSALPNFPKREGQGQQGDGEGSGVPPWGSGERPPIRERFDELGGAGGMDKMIDYIVTGVPLDKDLLAEYPLLPANIIEGTNLEPGLENMVVISEGLKDHFDADLGDLITISDISFQVKGIYSTEAQTKNVYMSLEDAREVVGLQAGYVQSINVYATNESVIDGLVTVLQDYYSDYRVSANKDMMANRLEMMERMTTEQVSTLEGDLDEMESTGDTIVLISMLASGLVVLFILLYTVKERTKEIGTMKALGFTRSRIMLQVVAEGAMISFIGGCIGVLVGYLGSPFFSQYLLPSNRALESSTPSVPVVILGLVAVLLIGTLGSLYPAYIASRKNPVEAMRHE
jgi:ABC-type antimicrobial peptide transport system permease subunit